MPTDTITRIRPRQAERAIEALRMGIPPAGMLSACTAWSDGDRDRLREAVVGAGPARGYLVTGGYGAGKSHWLAMAREIALAEGFAVAMLTLDAAKGIRFNRMDQIFGAAARGVAVPGEQGTGIGALFDAVGDADAAPHLGSAALGAGLRVWQRTGIPEGLRPLVSEWLQNPAQFTTRASMPYGLLPALERHRPRYARFAELRFDTDGYSGSWQGLADLDRIAKAAGLRGMVLLVDEFEDVLANLRNVALEEVALGNLTALLDGGRLPGTAMLAVTPEFEAKVRRRMGRRNPALLGMFDDPRSRFDIGLPDRGAQLGAGLRVRQLHGLAYQWDAEAWVADASIRCVLGRGSELRGVDQARQAVKALVELLDNAWEDAHGGGLQQTG